MPFESLSAAPAYRIDLDRPGAERWIEVIAAERAATQRLMAEAGKDLQGIPSFVGAVFAQLYRLSGGLYLEEMRAWADALGLSLGKVLAINCGYELDHALHMLPGFKPASKPPVAGCTNGIFWCEGRGPAHVRTLDWPVPALGAATRTFSFTRRDRELFRSVGFPGQGGVLSGLVPGRYSVTIDWAPPSEAVNFDFGPSFLLRHTLETCATFDAAVASLAQTPLSTSVFYIVCGVERGHACVIERTKKDHTLRRLTADSLVQANHFSPDLTTGLATGQPLNPDPRNRNLQQYIAGGDYVAGSTFLRYAAMQRAIQSLAGRAVSADEIFRAIDADPVTNPETCHRMVFFPAAGELHVQRRTGP